ncbi:MAG: HTTM domain-containing protein [Bdellovibrionia bacterium]
MKNILKLWDQFWFAPQNTLNLAFLRIVLCGTLFYLYLARSWNLNFFSSEAWVQPEQALQLLHEGYRPVFSWYFFSDSWAIPMHAMLVLILFFAMLGLGNRLLLLAAWVINIAFMQRNYAVNFGADVIGSLFLLYLSFTPAFERLSVVSLFRKRKFRESTSLVESVFYRLMMVQISIIYAYTGFEKLKGGSWWDGTALWSVVGNPQMTTMDFSWLRHFPLVIALMTFVTVLFEIYWPFAVFIRKTKYWFLGLGVMFHTGIALMMGLGPFSVIMMSTYFLFIDPIFLEKTVSKLYALKESILFNKASS